MSHDCRNRGVEDRRPGLSSGSRGPHGASEGRPPEDPLEARAIAAVKSGDREAYDYLVSKYMKRVVSIAWGLVRNGHDAEDLAQDHL